MKKSWTQRARDRVAYERTFTLAERWERGKEKLAQLVAWRLLPRRVRQWTVIRAHAAATASDQHPGTVSAFDLYKVNDKSGSAVS